MARKRQQNTNSKKTAVSRNGASGKFVRKSAASKRGQMKRELTANELTLIAWKKTYENHRRVKD